jgi:antitoxin YefM
VPNRESEDRDDHHQRLRIDATEERKRLYKLLDQVAQSREPIQVTGKRGSAVLVDESDGRAVQETLYLVSIPGMRESILGLSSKAWPPRSKSSRTSLTGELAPALYQSRPQGRSKTGGGRATVI